MTRVRLDSLVKQYAKSQPRAVDNISLDIPHGSLVSLLGPSGCGKSTTLKIVAGLYPPTSGRVYFDDKDVTDVPAERRDAVMVFQSHTLFPYMTVGQNIGFGLKVRRVDKATGRQKVGEMLDLVKLSGFDDRMPSELSGGQQQRVALARALVIQPQVLLLDEPLSNLDAHLKEEMRLLIHDVHQQFNITTIMVTHDQQEAMLMSEAIALLLDGKLKQYSAPEELYLRPVSQEIARFFGGINLIDGEVTDGLVSTPIGQFCYTLSSVSQRQCTLAMRPEQIQIIDEEASNRGNVVQGIIQNIRYAGTYTYYQVQVADVDLDVVRSADLPDSFQRDQPVWLHFPANRIWLIPRAD